MTNKLPEALRLADEFDEYGASFDDGPGMFAEAAALLRIQHALLEQAREATQNLCKLAINGESVLWTAEYDRLRDALAALDRLEAAAVPELSREDVLPAWEDPRVQVVYELLCNMPEGKPADDHWEGWTARHIVASFARSVPVGEARPVAWDASQIKQPGWHHVAAAFVAGAREARANPEADEHIFDRSADAYSKQVFEEVDPESERRLRTGDFNSPSVTTPPAPPEGWRMVPESALQWLFGEVGAFECPPERYFRGKPPAFWWRSVFRELIAAAPQPGDKA